MLRSTYNVTIAETLNLAVAASEANYIHVTQRTTILAIAVAVNGTTINSAADVDIDFGIVGGAALAVVSLPSGTTAGQGVMVPLVPPVVLPAGSVVNASVTNEATVAGGSGSITLGLNNG